MKMDLAPVLLPIHLYLEMSAYSHSPCDLNCYLYSHLIMDISEQLYQFKAPLFIKCINCIKATALFLAVLNGKLSTYVLLFQYGDRL